MITLKPSRHPGMSSSGGCILCSNPAGGTNTMWMTGNIFGAQFALSQYCSSASNISILRILAPGGISFSNRPLYFASVRRGSTRGVYPSQAVPFCTGSVVQLVPTTRMPTARIAITTYRCAIYKAPPRPPPV